MSRKKSKLNPKHICRCCEEKIFNRTRRSLYCISCSKFRHGLSGCLWNAIYKFRYHNPKYKDYEIFIDFMIKKKNAKNPKET